jgi:hypothetical protein
MRFERKSPGDVDTLATARIPKDCWLALFARIL